MQTNFHKIKELILQSNLSLIDQTELIEVLASAQEVDLEGVLELFSEDSSWIERISENYKAKRAAFITGNAAVWQDILQEEENKLKQLETS